MEKFSIRQIPLSRNNLERPGPLYGLWENADRIIRFSPPRKISFASWNRSTDVSRMMPIAPFASVSSVFGRRKSGANYVRILKIFQFWLMCVVSNVLFHTFLVRMHCRRINNFFCLASFSLNKKCASFNARLWIVSDDHSKIQFSICTVLLKLNLKNESHILLSYDTIMCHFRSLHNHILLFQSHLAKWHINITAR